MGAVKWMKWLSIFALIFASVDFIGNIYDFFSGEVLTLASVTIFLLAIVAVIISFKKK